MTRAACTRCALSKLRMTFGAEALGMPLHLRRRYPRAWIRVAKPCVLGDTWTRQRIHHCNDCREHVQQFVQLGRCSLANRCYVRMCLPWFPCTSHPGGCAHDDLATRSETTIEVHGSRRSHVHSGNMDDLRHNPQVMHVLLERNANISISRAVSRALKRPTSDLSSPCASYACPLACLNFSRCIIRRNISSRAHGSAISFRTPDVE